MPIVVAEGRNATELANFAAMMAFLNPNGFRQPGRRPGSTSLVERLAVDAGQIGPEPRFARSARGAKKRRRRAETRAEIREQYAREAEQKALEAGIL